MARVGPKNGSRNIWNKSSLIFTSTLHIGSRGFDGRSDGPAVRSAAPRAGRSDIGAGATIRLRDRPSETPGRQCLQESLHGRMKDDRLVGRRPPLVDGLQRGMAHDRSSCDAVGGIRVRTCVGRRRTTRPPPGWRLGLSIGGWRETSRRRRRSAGGRSIDRPATPAAARAAAGRSIDGWGDAVTASALGGRPVDRQADDASRGGGRQIKMQGCRYCIDRSPGRRPGRAGRPVECVDGRSGRHEVSRAMRPRDRPRRWVISSRTAAPTCPRRFSHARFRAFGSSWTHQAFRGASMTVLAHRTDCPPPCMSRAGARTRSDDGSVTAPCRPALVRGRPAGAESAEGWQRAVRPSPRRRESCPSRFPCRRSAPAPERERGRSAGRIPRSAASEQLGNPAARARRRRAATPTQVPAVSVTPRRGSPARCRAAATRSPRCGFHPSVGRFPKSEAEA
ncbi:hypothetical protein SAMN05192568_102722 [Methylobacterium pseudosasicola]|uniref:Uncharacterized protein n=1 Tax=Methylobacterium pseudosasicola TaxID=582667 RepID=A0A1I4PXX3_9HYPH|nr:hypothetical protein SAMN05192568_102722 [Methylobacterium pseudosasicola]